MLKKGLIAGVAAFIISMGVNFLLEAIIPGLAKEYQNPALFRAWTDPLMMAYFAYPFIFGIVASYLWTIVHKQFTGDAANKAWQFTKLYVIIATIPGMFVSYTSFQISLFMVLSWTLVGLLNAFVAGFIFAKVK